MSTHIQPPRPGRTIEPGMVVSAEGYGLLLVTGISPAGYYANAVNNRGIVVTVPTSAMVVVSENPAGAGGFYPAPARGHSGKALFAVLALSALIVVAVVVTIALVLS